MLEQYERDSALNSSVPDFGEEADDGEEEGGGGEEEEGESRGTGEGSAAKTPRPAKKPELARDPLDKEKGKGKGKSKEKGKEKSKSGKAVAGEGDGWGGEEYERFGLKHVEKTLWRFQKRLMVSPTQVARFPTYGDTPLLYTSDPKHCPPADDKIPRCEACGAARKFEFQLMPNVLSLLRPEASASSPPLAAASSAPGAAPSVSLDEVDGMEWSTVLVYTCQKSCRTTPGTDPTHPLKYHSEYVFVQPLL